MVLAAAVGACVLKPARSHNETPPLPPACTKQGHQKPVDSKDDNPEKHCPVTVNPWHMKKAFKVMNELR
ncbi:hypothetical protein STEG23_028616, partial [Scotinomys teguina]